MSYVRYFKIWEIPKNVITLENFQFRAFQENIMANINHHLDSSVGRAPVSSKRCAKNKVVFTLSSWIDILLSLSRSQDLNLRSISSGPRNNFLKMIYINYCFSSVSAFLKGRFAFRVILRWPDAIKVWAYSTYLVCTLCELMLLICQINTNTNKNGFLFSTKCLERVLKYSYLFSIIYFFYLYLSVLQPFCVNLSFY